MTKEEQGFNTLYRQYGEKLRGFIRWYMQSELYADDIMQDVFLNLWQTRERFRQVKYKQSYLFMMAKNRCADFKKYMVKKRKIEEYNGCAGYDTDAIIHKGYNKLFEQAVSNLPRRQRDVYLLMDLGYKRSKVAKNMGITPRTVSTTLQQGKKKVKRKHDALRSLRTS